MRSIYLDNSASTKVYPDVAELMCKTRRSIIEKAGKRWRRP